jgi:membrane associated rhomboid family serine protease
VGAVSDSLVVPARTDVAGPARDSRAAPDPADQLRAALREFLAALLERTFGIAIDKVEQLSQTFDVIAARGGFKIGAVFGGVRAAVAGKSPVWGAIMGGFSALGPGAKAAIITVLVLALLLLPVTVLLVLLLLIGVAVVAIVKSQSAGS